MPWIRDGKCVYKKNKDGSRGEKEGCSDSIEKAKDYLKALYANTDDAPKKENKSMKMKKSELIALIKEEIMAEAEKFNMSPEDLRDFSQPDPPEYQASDEAFNKVNELIKSFQEIASKMQDERDYQYELLDIIKEIITSSPELDPQAVAMQAFPLLIQKLKADSNQFPMMQEGTLKEGFDPNDFMTMAKAIKQLLSDPYTGPMFAAIIGGLPVMSAYEKHVLGKMNKEQPPVDGGEM
jgi:3-hydroxy-3-methylglutaryl CoA synthase